MYTQCPECDTIFRVNASVLRAAQGQVRCGVCNATFDAIRFLTDEIEAGVNAASASFIQADPETEAPPTAEPPPPTPPDADDEELADAPFRPSPSLPLVAFEIAEASNEWWATAVSAEIPGAVEPGVAPTPNDPTLGPQTAFADDDARSPTMRATFDAHDAADDPREPTLSAFDVPTATIAVAADERIGRQGPTPHRGGAGLVIAALTLSTMLVAQVIDHARERLATIPALAPALTTLYNVLGRSLEPRWDLGAYDIREWKATPDVSTQTIRLRAQILQHGTLPQPWPLLRVAFEDRYGGLVARRDFRPSEYLPDHRTQAGMMPPGTRIEAQLDLVDPGGAVVSYQIDTCLPQGDQIGCGADLKGTHAE